MKEHHGAVVLIHSPSFGLGSARLKRYLRSPNGGEWVLSKDERRERTERRRRKNAFQTDREWNETLNTIWRVC